ncbi:MAG TPA: class I SAM-dependent methyltransferase [Acidisarcina sp.]
MPLPRLQLFELEELEWFPHAIRDLALDYLGFLEVRFALHKAALPLLRRMIEQTGTLNVVDLCSGGGGLIQALYEALASDGINAQFTLTDKFPNLMAFRDICSQHPLNLHYVSGPVDATRVPPELIGLRTMFNAFHHFPPVDARRVLEGAVRAGQPICIFEAPERSLFTMIPLLLTPIFVALATPFIRPFRWKRLLWTYLIPLVPLMVCWDGIVSQLRAYKIDELSGLTQGFDNYEWNVGRTSIPGQPGHLTFLLGASRSDNASRTAPPCEISRQMCYLMWAG